jgi:hypothetical protein
VETPRHLSAYHCHIAAAPSVRMTPRGSLCESGGFETVSGDHD